MRFAHQEVRSTGGLLTKRLALQEVRSLGCPCTKRIAPLEVRALRSLLMKRSALQEDRSLRGSLPTRFAHQGGSLAQEVFPAGGSFAIRFDPQEVCSTSRFAHLQGAVIHKARSLQCSLSVRLALKLYIRLALHKAFYRARPLQPGLCSLVSTAGLHSQASQGLPRVSLSLQLVHAVWSLHTNVSGIALHEVRLPQVRILQGSPQGWIYTAWPPQPPQPSLYSL